MKKRQRGSLLSEGSSLKGNTDLAAAQAVNDHKEKGKHLSKMPRWLNLTTFDLQYVSVDTHGCKQTFAWAQFLQENDSIQTDCYGHRLKLGFLIQPVFTEYPQV